MMWKRHGKVRAECNARCNQCRVVRNDTRTKSHSDIMMRCCLPETGGSEERRVDESTDKFVGQKKSGSFFFGSSTCKMAKARHDKAHTRMKRATRRKRYCKQSGQPQRPFDFWESSSSIITTNRIMTGGLSGSFSGLFNGLVKVDILCSHLKPLARSLAGDSSFATREATDCMSQE